VLIMAVHQVPSLTQERYEEVVRRLTGGKSRIESLSDLPFDGLLVHLAGESKNGFCIVDIFESEEAIGRFNETTSSIPREAGIEEPPDFFPAHTYVVSPATPGWGKRALAEAENRQTVERVFRALSENDLELFHQQFREDAVIEFPQSGERIVGGENRRTVYSSPFPGRPTVRRVLIDGDLAVAEVSVDYGDATDWRAVFIYELSDHKISRVIAYWTQPFEAAESRAPWVERKEG
jgi:ketosteroid isomerase-like protein